MKLRIDMLTSNEPKKITGTANLSEEQQKLLVLLHRGKMNDVGIMSQLLLTERDYYQLKKDLQLKILRVLFEQNQAG